MKVRNTTNQDDKWDKMFTKLFEFSLLSRFEPDSATENELARWYRVQKSLLQRGKMREDRRVKLESITFELPANRKKWIEQFEQLLDFHRDNPDKWPVYERDNPDSSESQLSVFCQIIRERYRRNTLEDFWVQKFKSIQFNFQGRKDNWLEYYNVIETILKGKQSISISEIGEKPYNWMFRHKKLYDENKRLTDQQRAFIGKLNLERFFPSWDENFIKVYEWLQKAGKLPTRQSNKELHSWLYSQRTCFNNGSLNETQVDKLKRIGFDLIGLGAEKDTMRWKEQFKKLSIFRKKNPDRWPSFYRTGEEKELYNWCQSQRQAQAGTHSGGRKKPLMEWKVKLLDSIGFSWSRAIVKKNNFIN